MLKIIFPDRFHASSRGLTRLALAAGLSTLALMIAAHPAAAARAHQKPAAGRFDEFPLWTARPVGPVILVVSIDDQQLTIYDNGVPVAHSPVSTGIPGHPTPRGVFSVVDKDRYHKSNIYSDAPMPYMERITWSGIALHEGVVPGHPASHGCIRMPHAVAAKLWTYLKVGARVIIADRDVEPFEFSHPKLFSAAPKHETAVDAAPGPKAVQMAQSQMAQSVASPTSDAVATIPSTGAKEAQAERPAISVETTPATGALANRPTIVSNSPASPGNETSLKDQAQALPPVATPSPTQGAAPPAATAIAPRPPGHVAIFVSKKAGKLFVRQDFAPLFDAPITIDDPARPLGTHVFTAMEVKDNGARVRWTAMDVPDAPPPSPAAKRHKSELESDILLGSESPSAFEALNRITIPDDIREKIADLIIPGTSLVISDQGFGRETTKGTDFIVLTR